MKIILLNELGEMAEGQDVSSQDTQQVVLIPGEAVLLTNTKMPKMSRHELQKAIPYALEEQLAADVGKLHFAIGEYDDQDHVAVAVIDKSKLEHYLEALKSQDLRPDVMMPDYLALPFEKGCWTVCVTGSRALVRLGEQAGFATGFEDVTLLLNLMLDQSTELPEKLLVYGELPEAIKSRVAIEVMDQEMVWQPTTPINLLQGIYRLKNKPTKVKRYWKMATVMATVWLIVLLGTQATELIYFKIHTKQLQQKINATYRHIFPRSKDVVEPRFRIQHELDRLTRSSHKSRFINLLSKAASLLQQHPKVELKSLSYQDKQLILQLRTDKISRLEGFNIKQTHINPNTREVMADVVVK